MGWIAGVAAEKQQGAQQQVKTISPAERERAITKGYIGRITKTLSSYEKTHPAGKPLQYGISKAGAMTQPQPGYAFPTTTVRVAGLETPEREVSTREQLIKVTAPKTKAPQKSSLVKADVSVIAGMTQAQAQALGAAGTQQRLRETFYTRPEHKTFFTEQAVKEYTGRIKKKKKIPEPVFIEKPTLRGKVQDFLEYKAEKITGVGKELGTTAERREKYYAKGLETIGLGKVPIVTSFAKGFGKRVIHTPADIVKLIGGTYKLAGRPVKTTKKVGVGVALLGAAVVSSALHDPGMVKVEKLAGITGEVTATYGLFTAATKGWQWAKSPKSIEQITGTVAKAKKVTEDYTFTIDTEYATGVGKVIVPKEYTIPKGGIISEAETGYLIKMRGIGKQYIAQARTGGLFVPDEAITTKYVSDVSYKGVTVGQLELKEILGTTPKGKTLYSDMLGVSKTRVATYEPSGAQAYKFKAAALVKPEDATTLTASYSTGSGYRWLKGTEADYYAGVSGAESLKIYPKIGDLTKTTSVDYAKVLRETFVKPDTSIPISFEPSRSMKNFLVTTPATIPPVVVTGAEKAAIKSMLTPTIPKGLVPTLTVAGTILPKLKTETRTATQTLQAVLADTKTRQKLVTTTKTKLSPVSIIQTITGTSQARKQKPVTLLRSLTGTSQAQKQKQAVMLRSLTGTKQKYKQDLGFPFVPTLTPPITPVKKIPPPPRFLIDMGIRKRKRGAKYERDYLEWINPVPTAKQLRSKLFGKQESTKWL